MHQPSRPRGWSGQRDSNPRHQAWEACTLPAELCPLNAQQVCLINFSRNVKTFSCLRPKLPVETPRFGTSAHQGGLAELAWGMSCGRKPGRLGYCPDDNLPPGLRKILMSFKLIRRGADRVSKSWPWSPNMKTLYLEKSAWLAAGLRVACLGLIALLLLPALAPGQSAWPSGGSQPPFRVHLRSGRGIFLHRVSGQPPLTGKTSTGIRPTPRLPASRPPGFTRM